MNTNDRSSCKLTICVGTDLIYSTHELIVNKKHECARLSDADQLHYHSVWSWTASNIKEH